MAAQFQVDATCSNVDQLDRRDKCAARLAGRGGRGFFGGRRIEDSVENR